MKELTPEQKKKVEDKLAEIKAVMHEALKPFIGEPVPTHTVQQIVTDILLKYTGVRQEWIKLHCTSPDDDEYCLELGPGNLYTAILMASADKLNHLTLTEEDEIELQGCGPYTAPDGTVFELQGHKLMMTLPMPLNYIDVTFTVGGDDADKPS